MANDRAPRVTSADRVDLSELPPGSLVEIKTKNSTYWLTTLSTTFFGAGYATGIIITSSRADSWGHPRDIVTSQIKRIGDLLSISNHKENLGSTTTRITSITVIQ